MKTSRTKFLRRFRQPLAASLTGASLCLMLLASVSAAPDAGWQALGHNSEAAARAGFQASLRKNPADVEALCGLTTLLQEKDDEASAILTLRRLYAAAPASPEAAALWPQMVTLTEDTGRWTLLEGAARDVLASKNTLPSLQASARLALALSASRSGREAEAETQRNTLGYARRWQVIGPFDNASQSGFDKVFLPEQQLSFGGVSIGKDDQTLHWHSLGLVNLDGQCEVAQALGDTDADVFYAVTALQSPKTQAAVLQFDPTGASKINLNGAWVYADPIRRSHSHLVADPMAISVTLQAGWNTVLVKLADDEKLAGAFSLRLTTPSGDALASLPTNPLQAKTLPAASAAASPAAPETALVTLLRHQPSSLENAVLLGETLRLAHDYPASAEALRQGLVAAPDCGLLHWELSQTLTADAQDDDARTERDMALKQDPHLIEAALDAVSETEDNASPGELVTHAQAVAASDPTSPDALWALAHAYDKAKLNSETLKTARRAYLLAPGSGSLTQLTDLLTAQDKNREAASLLSAALKTAPGEEVLLSERAGTLADQDNAPAGIAVTQRLLAVDPVHRSSRVSLARLQQQAGQPAAALLNLRLARAQCPQDADTAAALADLLQEQEQGHTKEAVSLYRDAIRLDPSELTLRDKLAVLEGTKPVLDLAPAADSGPILAAAAHLKAEPDASAVLLLDEGRTVVYPDFASLTRYHQIIKLVDQSAVQRYSDYPLSRSTSTSEATVESARVIKVDGKVQDVTEDADKDSIPFPSLAPGDVLDVSYRVEDYHPGGLAHQFWSEWFFDGSETPSRLSRYVLITPTDLAFRTRNHGHLPDPSVHDTGGWRVHEWRMADVPARPSEIMGTTSKDSGTWLDISTIKSWSEIVQWYEDLSAPRCVPDAAIRTKAADLTKDAHTDQQKIQAIQAYVARDIEYQSSPFRLSAYVPTEGKEVIRERYGDCKDKAALVTSLLAAVGLKSDMVLLSGRNQGLTPFLPSPRFSHAIARVQTAQGSLFVDATADQLDFGDLPADDQQVPALIITPATTDLSETPVLPIDGTVAQETYTDTLGADGSLKGDFVWTLTGRLAWGVRSVLREVPEAKHEEMLHSIANYLVKGAVCESDGIEYADNPNVPLQFHFAFHVDRYSTSAGSFLLMPLPWSGETREASVSSLLAEPARTEDLEAASSRARTSAVAHLRLPPGYTPQELPADAHQETPYGSFRFHYQMDGDLLTATRDVDATALRVPAQDVPKYAAFLKALDDEMTRQLVLKKSP